MFGMYAVIFYVGAIFRRDYALGLDEMFTALFGIIFAAFGSGHAA